MIKLSIIIPVYNDMNAINLTINSLRNQNYPANNYEIIVIDNGSTDGTAEWLAKQTDIKFLYELNYKNSPYSARNRGIEIAQGEIIALLDATCIPDNNWVYNGLNFFSNNNFSIFSGSVIFNFDNSITAAKIYDSITNIQVEEVVNERQVAQTANLWVKKELFRELGLFREGVRSGEDFRWTRFATKEKHFHLGYSKNTIAYKSARNLKQLLKKKVRVGNGHVYRWKIQGILLKKMLESFKWVLPIKKPSTFKKLINRIKIKRISKFMLLKIFLVSYLDGLATFVGNIIGYLHLLRKDEKHVNR